MNKRDYITILVCLLISIITGLISKDLILGGSILLSGLLAGYFATVGNKNNYIFGFINYMLMAYAALKNNLYGIFFFYIFIFSPLQLSGYITWGNNLNRKGDVKVREFTLRNSIIIVLSCILGSVLLSGILSMIPNQQLAFLDASSNCINLCGVVLMLLRFKEAWWVWLANNVIDFIIWIIVTLHGGENAIMMLVCATAYLVINIYGILRWSIEAKKNRKKKYNTKNEA